MRLRNIQCAVFLDHTYPVDLRETLSRAPMAGIGSLSKLEVRSSSRAPDAARRGVISLSTACQRVYTSTSTRTQTLSGQPQCCYMAKSDVRKSLLKKEGTQVEVKCGSSAAYRIWSCGSRQAIIVSYVEDYEQRAGTTSCRSSTRLDTVAKALPLRQSQKREVRLIIRERMNWDESVQDMNGIWVSYYSSYVLHKNPSRYRDMPYPGR